MFLRLVTDSFTRRPRRQLLTGAALALGMAVATAAISVALDVGDRLALEFRSLGANMVVTPEADSLPLEIGGVDYRPANSGTYLPESDLPKLKQVYWHNNIIAFAPTIELQGSAFTEPRWVSVPQPSSSTFPIVGAWAQHNVTLSDGSQFLTGSPTTKPWWRIEGRWFDDNKFECVIGKRFGRGYAIGDSLVIQWPALNLHYDLKITGILDSGEAEDEGIVIPLSIAQQLANRPGQYRKLYVSALTKPEDDFARRDPKSMNADEFERWSCSPYVSSIAYSIRQALPGTDVRVIHRVADGEGVLLHRLRAILGLVMIVALLAAALAVGASSAAGVLERRTEIGLMKALGAGSATVGFLLAAEQLLLAIVGGGIGYAIGVVLARIVGNKIFGVAPEPSLFVLAIILALAAAVTLLGSALPLRRAARFQPAPILRGE